MLPKEDGGVVDASLKVYGTKNLRVVSPSFGSPAVLVPVSVRVASCPPPCPLFASFQQGVSLTDNDDPRSYRVSQVDASVIPVVSLSFSPVVVTVSCVKRVLQQISYHPQATVYAIAEKVRPPET